MSLGDFLMRLTSILEQVDVDYMIVGSFASTVHGVARSTQDVDIVVALDRARLTALLRACPEDEYYVSEDAARDALRYESLFNIIDMKTGWKADLIVKKSRPFSVKEFDRRQLMTLGDQQLYVASAEDIVIAKMEWALSSASERQIRDVTGILDVKGSTIDLDYITMWAQKLGLIDLWDRIRASMT